MADNNHPRASGWLIDDDFQPARTLTAEQWGAAIRMLQNRLQNRLLGTGLQLVGRPVVDKIGTDGNVRMSWKVYSSPWDSEENNCG